jgi:O-antigen/teichoic acid export membrane protein
MTSPAHSAPGGHIRGLARGGLLNFAGAIVASVVNVLLILVVTRQVSPDRAGSLFAATSLFLMAAAAARLGTITGLVYWLARLRATGRSNEIPRCLRFALVPVAVVGIVIGVAMFVAAEPLGELVGGDRADIAIGYLRGLAIFLPLAALSEALLAATRGLGVMRPTVVVDNVAKPLFQLGLTAGVIALSAPRLLAVAWALPFAAAAVVAALWLADLLRRHPDHDTDPGAGQLRAAEFWRYTAPRSVSTLVQLALQRMDIVLVAALRGPADAAIYTAATRLLVVGQLGSQAVATAAQPRLAALLAVDDRPAAGRLYQIATGWLVLATWPFYLLCVAFPAELTALFGEGYDEGAPVVAVLGIAMLVATGCGMVDVMLNMAGRTMWTLANSIAALATMVVLDLALIPRLGILGAGLGWAAAIVVNNIVPLIQLRLAYGLHPFGPETRRAVVIAGTAFGSVAAIVTLFELPSGWQVFVLVCALACFAVAVVRSRRALALDAFVAALRRQSPANETPLSSAHLVAGERD